MIKKQFLLWFFIFFSISLFSQTYTLNNGSNGTITTCSGTFVDNGGNVADYGNNQNSTITFCPSTPGEIIKVVFTSFSTEAFAGTCTDYLDVWYGNTVGAPGTNNDRLCGNVGNTTFVSTSPDGCISFQFISNGNVNQAGWSATISCVTPCTNPIAALTDSSPVNICPSTATNPGPLAVSFNASASTASGGFSVSSYEWAWGDGTSSITTTPTTTHTYSGPGIYSVSLIVRNNNTDIYPLGCQSTNPATRVVRVYPPPNFTGSSPTTVNVNCGESLNLNGLVSSQTISSIPLAVSQSTITLADAAGVNYDSTIDISGFFPSGSIVTPSCYPTITFDLEHTHSGDLEITLISPTGQSVMIYDQHGGTNDFGICANPLDNGVAGCPATYTVVNSGGVNWTAAGVTTTAPANGACTYTGACEVGSNYISQTYNSTNPFTALNGAGLNGIWTLRVRDNLSADDGTISGWSLTFPTSCYTNSEFVTPDIATLTWSTTGVGPAVPSQTTTSVAVIDPGPGGCPTPGTCIGNKLTNNVTIGPFLNSGTFSYALTAVDEYGCNYVRNVAVNVATCPCLLNLTSLSNTNNQSVCLGSAIVPITYNYGGVSTGATVTGLPPGLNLNISGGLITISGTPTAIGTFNFTVNSTGCSPNISLTGKIIVQTAPSLTSITNNTPICLNSTATFNLVGTPNAIVSYNINGSSSQNVTLNPSGIATISIPSVGSNTNFNAISITNSGTIITGNGSSASGGPNAIRATGPISNLGAAAGNPNCALVNSLNPNLTITLPQIVPIGTTITISLARDNTSGEVTVASGGASSIFNSGINDFLERIIITTITQTNVVTITSRAGAVWVDGVEFAFTLPGCTSLITNTSTVNISTPAVPIIATTAPTCLSDSTSSISNYIATNTYAFTPSGPTVGATGAITGMVIGTSYTVTASNASCISASSASFITAVQLTAPSVPIITTTAATCLASGTTTINNYTSGINYVFIPTGPIVTGTGTILGLTNGTSYTVTASNGSCSSVVSAAFSNTEQLATPTVPTIAYVAPTCLTDGSSSVSNYSATNTYAFSPSGPTVGAAGEIIGMVLGTSYTVTANNGICVSTASAPFSNASQLITPVAPIVSETAPTCLADGFSTITNYDGTLNYVFNPAGPTINASGLIQGMVLGTSYSVTSTNASLCTSLVSNNFVNNPMLLTPVVPTISITAPTCLADGFATITNYDATLSYVFTPAGPTVGAGGLVSGMTFGTSYVVAASNGSCSSVDTASFSVDSILPTPVAPIVSETAPTCLADGFSTITNYDGTLNYVFNPAGPTINASGLIQGMVLGTSYSVTSTNASLCTSLVSNNFVNNPMLLTPVVPTISITAPTCLADGFATVTNHDATLSYVFTPAGPTVGAGGLVSGMTFGTSYVVAASNGSCSSVDTASFSVDSILPTPVAPIVSETAPTCLADGFSTITNYDGTLNYVFNPAGPTINASGLIQGMVLGTSYSVTSTNASLCTSLVSNNFVNNPMLLTPVVPTISITAPTCLADGFATVTNYDATLSYVFTPAGPTVGAGGLVSGMTFGTSYVVAASNGSCSSVDTASFSVDSILPTPVAPIVSETAPTCLADGFSTITNYDGTLNYVFNPAGPTINASGLIQGMVLGTSYSVTSTNASLCTSLVSNNFVNNPMLLTPVVPTISITAPTCLADGFATVTNYDATLSYVFTPAGPTVGAGGLVSGMTFGTSYVVAASNGSCSSVDTASFSVDSILPTPVAPIVSETAPTCLADGFSTITNYDATLNYVFNPAGPTINASGLIQGMVLGTSYSVTSTNASLCTSLVSNNFVNNPMLLTPVVPTISITAPTCLADGFATITNYDATLSYVFTPAGPTVGAGGLVSGMTFGTSYVVAASNGSCSSVDTASFSVDSILPTPVAPIVSETAPTCLADGFSTITNYDGTLNYVFNPAGPTINASGLIQGMVLGTSYSVTSTNASLCTSLVSNNFINNPMLVTPVVPTISITAPTCLADGFATVTNYDATLSYVFTPAGPTVGAGGLVSGMTFGTSYVVAASNGSCSSVDTASFSVDSILPTPVAPIVSETAPTCLADGFSTITNYDGTLNYVFNPAGPTINASGLIQGMVLGTSYSVTSTNASLCTSLVSNNFVNNPMLLTPVVPTISITAPTCLADGFATITNYDATLSYVFTPAGPTVGAGGLVSGMTFGTSYVVAASNGSCSSVDTASFSVDSILPTPVAPIVSETAPTCLADGFSTITNYDGTLNYVFNPAGPTINASGLIQGMVLGTSYSVTSTNASLCTSLVSNNFVNNPMLLTPVVPTISITAPTCLADGFATVTNYDATLSYVFTPAGPTVGAGGLVSGMTFGSGYVVAASNGSCSSVNTTSFVVTQQLPLPTIVSVTNNGPICLGGTAIFTITATPNSQVIYSVDGNPTQTASINASGVGIVNVTGVTASTTLTTISVFDGICSSNFSLTSTVNLFANTTISLVSNSGTDGQTRCAGVTIDPIQYQVTGTATGVVVTGLPVGVTYDYNVATGLLTIAGATNIAGVYNYSIITSGGCNPQASASGSITITGLPVLSYLVTDTICDGSTLDFVLNSSLPNTTYIWSATVSNISGSYSTTTNGDETNINQIATLTDSENIGTITIVIIPMANGCYGVASNPIVITVNPIPLVESVSVADSSVCSATNTTNNVHVDIVGNISGITYSWTAITSGVNVVGGPTSGTIIATSTTAMIDLQVITSNPLVAGTIYFEVTPIRNGCPGNLLTSGIVTVNPNPGLPISSPVKTICSGNSTDLMIDVSPLITGTQLTWEVLTVVNVTGATPGTGIAPSPINDVLTATTNTQGYVIYRVRSTLGDCQGGYTDYRVNVNPSPLPVLTDGNICITATGEVYQTYTLTTGLNDADYDFEWFDSNGTIIAGATNSTLVVDAAGTYSVIATNWLTGCSSDPLLASATATVTATTPATSMTIVQSEYFSENATIIVTVPDGSGTLMYSLDEGALQSSNVFTGVSAGEHIVTVIDTEGCTYMTQEVMVIDYPTYFTPNGDGINDTWNIVGLNQADAKLYIYDRYGKLLKQLSATQDSNGWDGTHNQEQLPSTDYWFTLDYTENGVAKQFKAHFSLNR